MKHQEIDNELDKILRSNDTEKNKIIEAFRLGFMAVMDSNFCEAANEFLTEFDKSKTDAGEALGRNDYDKDLGQVYIDVKNLDFKK